MTIQPHFGTKIDFAYQSNTKINNATFKKLASDTAQFLADRYDTSVIPVIQDPLEDPTGKDRFTKPHRYLLLDDTDENHASTYIKELMSIGKRIGDEYFPDKKLVTLDQVFSYAPRAIKAGLFTETEYDELKGKVNLAKAELANQFAETPRHEKFMVIAHGTMPEVVVDTEEPRTKETTEIYEYMLRDLFNLKGWSFLPPDA